MQKEAFKDWVLRLYKAFPCSPYIGLWTVLGTHYLMIRNDFDLIRAIRIKDFDHFAAADGNVASHKSVCPASKIEKLMLNNVQSARGDEWKDIRYVSINLQFSRIFFETCYYQFLNIIYMDIYITYSIIILLVDQHFHHYLHPENCEKLLHCFK